MSTYEERYNNAMKAENISEAKQVALEATTFLGDLVGTAINNAGQTVRAGDETVVKVADLYALTHSENVNLNQVNHLVEEIKTLTKEVNKKLISDTALEYVHLATTADDGEAGLVDLWDVFLKYRSVLVEKLAGPDKNGNYAINVGDKNLTIADLESAFATARAETDDKGNPVVPASMQLTHLGCYNKMCDFFTHNLYMNLKNHVEEEIEKKAATLRFLGGDSSILGKTYGPLFGGTEGADPASKTSLLKQLQALVDAILPEGIKLKMLKADINYVIAATNNGNVRTGTLVHSRETTVLEFVTFAMEHRMYNIPYDVESKALVHKEKKSR